MLKSCVFFSIWLFILQILTSFAGIFFFSTVPRATADFASSLTAVRTVQMNFSETSRKYSFDEFTQIVEKNNIASPEYYTFEFSSENGLVSATTDFDKRVGNIIEGRGITKDDIESCARYVVVGTTVLDESGIHKTELKIGDSVKINGVDFEIIGFNKTLAKNFEIPYTTGFEVFPLANVFINFPSGLSDSQLDSITEYCLNSLENVYSSDRITIGAVLMSYNGSMIIASIFVIIIALLNLCFIYKFILRRMNKYFTVLRICGMSSCGVLGHIYAVYAIILVLSFALGTAAMLIVYKTADLEVLKNISIDFSVIITVFLAFAAVVAILLIQAVAAVKKPIKEELLV